MIPFWFDNYYVLFNKNYLTEFFPTKFMTMNQKLNSIVRFSFYASLLLVLFTRNLNYLYFFVIISILTIFLHKYQKDNKEFFVSEYQTNCIKPTNNNPFMNFNLITDPRNKEDSCIS